MKRKNKEFISILMSNNRFSKKCNLETTLKIDIIMKK